MVSVDINSGMNGDTGKGDLVVRSDLTVTIGYLKAGMFLGEAVWKVGRLVVADIGIRLVREDFLPGHAGRKWSFPAVVCLFRAAKLR